ncbi:hypothetical protein ACFLS9_10450 [Bacteroidota bacterium]
MLKGLFIIILIFTIFPLRINTQVLVDKGKGDHNQTRKGFMNGNLVATVYYNFGEIADWLNDIR